MKQFQNPSSALVCKSHSFKSRINLRGQLLGVHFATLISCLLVLPAEGQLGFSTAPNQIWNDYWNDQFDAMARQRGESMGNALLQIGQGSADMSQQIAAARQRYWKEFPDGTNYAAADREFGELLWKKDLYFALMTLLPRAIAGQRSPQADLFSRLSKLVDGGIRQEAGSEFDDWMKAAERHFEDSGGVNGANFLSYPLRVLDAALSCPQEYARYKRARDWAEFDLSGLQLSPKDYALMLLERFPHLKSREEAGQLFQELLPIFGEKQMLEMAKRISKAPRDNRGSLTHPDEFGIIQADTTYVNDAQGRPMLKDVPIKEGLVAVHSVDRFFVFLAALGMQTDQGYLCWEAFRDSDIDWTKTKTNTDLLIAAYGEDEVLTAAHRIRMSPRFLAGLSRDPELFDGITLGAFKLIKEALHTGPNLKGYTLLEIVAYRAANRKSLDTNEMFSTYDKLVAAYGENRVLDAAGKVRAAAYKPSERRSTLNRGGLFIADPDAIGGLSVSPFACLTEILAGGRTEFSDSEESISRRRERQQRLANARPVSREEMTRGRREAAAPPSGEPTEEAMSAALKDHLGWPNAAFLQRKFRLPPAAQDLEDLTIELVSLKKLSCAPSQQFQGGYVGEYVAEFRLIGKSPLVQEITANPSQELRNETAPLTEIRNLMAASGKPTKAEFNPSSRGRWQWLWYRGAGVASGVNQPATDAGGSAPVPSRRR